MSYIAHHGIKGQKWGVRRFQNEDGSLTALGKERYYSNSDSERVYKSIQDKTRLESGRGIFKSAYVDPSASKEIKEAGDFLKKQYGIAEKKGQDLQSSFRKELSSFISDKRNEQKVLQRLREYYSDYEDSEYVPDEYDIEFAVADLVSDKFYTKNKKAISDYDKMEKTYRSNLRSAGEDIVGSFGDRKIKALSDETNIFGKQKSKKRSYSSIVNNTLEKMAGDSWGLPRIDYDGDDLGGLDEILGSSNKEFEKYCNDLAGKYKSK